MDKGLKQVRNETLAQIYDAEKQPRWKSIPPETPAMPERIYYAVRENGALVKIELFGYRGERNDKGFHPVAARIWNERRARWQWPDLHWLRDITLHK